MNPIKKSEVTKLIPKRSTQSHKGENGRVLIIGGSLDYFGAPILSGLGAIGSGADLAYLLVPECNFEVTRSFYPDFIVRKYPGNFVNTRMMDQVNLLLPKTDALLIGPGVSEDAEVLRAIEKVIERADCEIVLDAEAIPAIAHFGLSGHNKKITITPHRGEFDLITDGTLPDDEEEIQQIVEDFANKWGITVLLKSPRCIISAPGKPTRINHTGNAGMTVGGSGDVLAGFAASLIAQNTDSYDACLCASFLLGTAGDNLFQQKGFNYVATDLALELPYAIQSVIK